MTLVPDQLRRLAAVHPDQVGFTVAGVGALTLGEWHTASSRFARGLVARGVVPGDRVALLVAPGEALRFVVAYAGTHKAGAVAVPVNARMTAREVAAVLRHCEPSVVVVSPALLGLLAQARAALRALLVSTGAAAPGVLDWDEVPAADGSDLQVPRDTDDLAEILYTSGTTGTPKGVAVRHGNSALFLVADPDWTGRPWLHASPLFTMAGLTFVYQPMRMGMRTLYQPRFDAGEWLALVRAERPAATFLVPAMVELLIAHPDVTGTDLSCLEMVSVGAAPIAPATLGRLQELVPDAMVTNSYSMTEAGTAYFVMPKGELRNHPDSVGKPLPPARVRVVDDSDRDCPADAVGHVLVEPAGRMREYYRDPDASAAVFGPDGWLRTGDLGRLDAEGYLSIVGRAKDLIIRGGHNVHPTDVEYVLYEHPAVREAAVVGVPHPVLGEDVAAYVVPREPAGVDVDELVAFCRERLADYKVPRAVHLVDELPRNATGKVLKRELVARLAEV